MKRLDPGFVCPENLALEYLTTPLKKQKTTECKTEEVSTTECEIYKLPRDIFSLCVQEVSTCIDLQNNCLVSKKWSFLFSITILQKTEEKGKHLLAAISNIIGIIAPPLLHRAGNEQFLPQLFLPQLKEMQASQEKMQQKIHDQLEQIRTTEATIPEQHELIVRQAWMREKLIDVYKDYIERDQSINTPNILKCMSALSQVNLEDTTGEEGKSILNQLIMNKCFDAALALVEQQQGSMFQSRFIVNPMQQFFNFIISHHSFEAAKNVFSDIFNSIRRKEAWEGLVQEIQTEACLSIEKCEFWFNQMIDLILPFEGESRIVLERILVSHFFCTIFQLYSNKQNKEPVIALLSKCFESSDFLTEQELWPLASCISSSVIKSDLDYEHQEDTLKFLSCFPIPLLTSLIRILVSIFNNSLMNDIDVNGTFDAQNGLWPLICKMHRLLDADSIPFSTMDCMIYTCLLKNPDLLIDIIENREPEFIEFSTLLIKFLEKDPTTFHRHHLSSLKKEEQTESIDWSDSDEWEMESEEDESKVTPIYRSDSDEFDKENEEDEFNVTALDRSDSDEFDLESEEDEFKVMDKGVKESIIKVFPAVVQLLQKNEKEEVITAIIQSFPFDQRNQLNVIAENASVNS